MLHADYQRSERQTYKAIHIRIFSSFTPGHKGTTGLIKCSGSKGLTVRINYSTTDSWDLWCYTVNYERAIAAGCHSEEENKLQPQARAEIQAVTHTEHSCWDSRQVTPQWRFSCTPRSVREKWLNLVLAYFD